MKNIGINVLKGIIRIKSILSIVLFLMIYIPLVSQELPEFTFTDPLGDVLPASVDITGGWFVQDGDSLLFGYQMAAPFADRIPWGNALNEFFLDADGDITTGGLSGFENILDFMDWGDGNWFGNFWVLWDNNIKQFMEKLLVPVTVHKDGKSLTCKVSLVGTGWDEIEYFGSGWYKDGSTWHQVPHYTGDAIDGRQFAIIDVSQVTQLIDKEGANCIIKVPEPYSATADAKNITGVVDEMVNLVRSQIDTIAESDKKFRVSYENFTDYAHPCSYGFGGVNQFGCRIPGQYWVDEPDWYAMLEGVVDQTLKERSAGLREVFLTQKAYHRPIPISGEGWYCTDNDSTNGFKWDAHHKWTFKALLGNAYENCYVYYIAESMTDGESKTAIMNKKADMINAWNNFSDTAKDLTPDIMTGLLLSLTDDLSWTECIFEEIVPESFDLEDEDTIAFEQIVIDYIRNEDFIISNSDDFLTQAHHGWYATIASVQAAMIELAIREDVYDVLKAIPGFPLDQDIFNTTKGLLTEVAKDYIYPPIKRGSEEWQRLSPEERHAICQIPYLILITVSTEFLIQAYLDYPFIAIMAAYDNWMTGFNRVYRDFNGLRELLRREGAGQKVLQFYKGMNPGGYSDEWSSYKKGKFAVNFMYIEILLAQECVLQQLKPSEITEYLPEGINKYNLKKEHIELHGMFGLGFTVFPLGRLMRLKSSTIAQELQQVPYMDLFLNTAQVANDSIPSIIIQLVPEFQQEMSVVNSPLDIKMPEKYTLHACYPNPFNPLTNIVFDLPEESRVSLVIYDLAGHKVWEMPNNGRVMSAGQYTFQWNGTDMDNIQVATGIYFIRLITPGYNQTRKVIFMK